MKKLIVANWKMNPVDKGSVVSYFSQLARAKAALKHTDVVIVPPFPYLALTPRSNSFALGAQDIFWEKDGAYTGEVSGPMLKSLGVQYVIIGHSERRALGETDDMIAKKIRRALDTKLTPILCVGEDARDPDGIFFSVIRGQLERALLLVKQAEAGRLVIAYEPLWAVGAGHKAATPKDAAEAALFIKKTVAARFGSARAKSLRVLYGGSTSPQNAASFLVERDIAGLLVGRESLNPKSFIAILQCANTNS
ncbi:MAG: triose-phosphate isomerase [Patescibacteria group bacterium]